MAEKPKRRRLFRPRYTLAALLLLVTALCPPLAFVAQRRAWNARRIAAHEHLHRNAAFRTITLGEIPDPPQETVWSHLASIVLLEGLVAPVTRISLFDNEGVNGIERFLHDDDVRLLTNFPELEVVNIQHAAAVTDDGLTVLGKLPKLKSIELLAMPNVKGAFLKELADSKELMHLSLDSLPALEGESLAALHKLPNLHFLKLFLCPKLNDDSLRNVSLPPIVKRVSFAELDIGDETILRWLNQTQLLNLTLNVDITRRVAPALALQTNLESLCIINAPLEDPDFEFLSQCANLNQLILNGMPVEGAFLKNLKASPSIAYINLNSTLLTDEYAAELRRCEKLNALYLRFTPIKGECFVGAAPWPPIVAVTLIGAEFNDPGKNALANLKGPKAINLPSNWTWRDLQRAQDGKVAFQYSVNLAMANSTVAHPSAVTSVYEPADSIDPIDRCPQERMAPVLRLHQLAREHLSKKDAAEGKE